MKEIKLSNSMVALVDDEDFELINKSKWWLSKGNDYTNYAQGFRNGKKILMHRFILELNDSNILADHIDKNGLNNQKYNLRIANKSQNCANRKPKENATSKYLGVFKYSKTKWRADIQKNQITKYLGTFDNEMDAKLAYNKAAIELHGEFANIVY